MNWRWLAVLLIVLTSSPSLAEEKVDLAVIHRIKEEAFKESKVMDHLFYLTDVHGPRLTGSPGFRAAAEWAVQEMKKWGVESARLEKWGEFGRGWSSTGLSISMTEPVVTPLSGVPLAWSAGTEGPITAEVFLAPLFPEEEERREYDLPNLTERIQEYMKQYQGKLRGKMVLIEPARKFSLPSEPAGQRFDEAKLADVLAAPEPIPAPPLEWPILKVPSDTKLRRQLFADAPTEVLWDYFERLQRVQDDLNRFLHEEGVSAVVSVDRRGDGSIIFAEAAGSHKPGAPTPPPSVVLFPEQYNRIVRLVEKKIPVKLQIELRAQFHEQALDGVNVVGEIPGGRKKDEVVMLGAHLDSWHGGTGATDNGSGSAVVLEALRVLKALNLKTDRTVRLALWGGEEQGLLGSRGYVKEHFGDPVTMALKPEHARLAAYFNVDNGSGKIRGIYLQGNEMVRPLFEAWLAPFKDLGATGISIRNTGGTDHLSFDQVGLPGFQFIQDPLDYGTRTHHSNVDVYDHAQPGDLMQAAAILASFVYHAASREEMLPRKPLPKPLPPKTETTEEARGEPADLP